MAYKFQVGPMVAGAQDGSGKSLQIQGNVTATADAQASVEAEKITTETIETAGNLTAATMVVASDVDNASIRDSANSADERYMILAQDDGNDKIFAAFVKQGMSELAFYKNGGAEGDVLDFNGGKASGTGAKGPDMQLENADGAKKLRFRLKSDGGHMGVGRNITIGAADDFNGNGNVTITGNNGDQPTFKVEGSLDVKGNFDANATDLVTIKDALVGINSDATTAADSYNSAILFGKATANGAKMIFKENTSLYVGSAFEFQDGNGSGIPVLADNFRGLADGLTNIPSAKFDNNGVAKFVFNEQTGATYTTVANDAGKVIHLNRNGVMTITMRAVGDYSVGQIIRFKAGAHCSTTNRYTIQTAGSDRIGTGTNGLGMASIVLESPFAAVDLVVLGTISCNGNSVARYGLF